MNTTLGIYDAQLRVLAVYGLKNAKYFNVYDLQNRMNRRAGTLMRTTRRFLRATKPLEQEEQRSLLRKQVVQVFAGVCSIANSANVDLQNNLFLHFPGIDPACGKKVCICGESDGRLLERVPLEELYQIAIKLEKGKDAQRMLRTIFPKNTLEDAVEHLLEESGELAEAITLANVQARLEDYRPVYYNRHLAFLLELSDVLAFVFGIASLLNVNLIEQLHIYLEDGCPVCHKDSCKCESENLEQKPVGTQPISQVKYLPEASPMLDFIARRAA